jgi:hypothetical protein
MRTDVKVTAKAVPLLNRRRHSDRNMTRALLPLAGYHFKKLRRWEQSSIENISQPAGALLAIRSRRKVLMWDCGWRDRD